MDSAVIGAVSALAGVALSQALALLQSQLERKHQRTTLLRSKLEELAGNLHQAVRWADTTMNKVARSVSGEADQSDQSDQSSPAASAEGRRVYVLSLLYFPLLKEESRRLLAALDSLYLTANGEKVDMERLAKTAGDFAAAREALDALITIESGKIL